MEFLWPFTATKHTLNLAILSFSECLPGLHDTSHSAETLFCNQPKSLQLALTQPVVWFHSLFNLSYVPLFGTANIDPLSSHPYSALLFSSSRQALNLNFLSWMKYSLDTQEWSTWLSTPWRFPQHINALELQSIVLATRRVLSSPFGTCNRLMILTDSAVVAFSLMKGRSSAPNLINGMRKLCALSLSSDLQLQICWIPTSLNPADDPSRNQKSATDLQVRIYGKG